MNRIVSSGLICVKNRLNVEFSLCKIEYTLYENGAFKYVFTPYYDRWSLSSTIMICEKATITNVSRPMDSNNAET